MELDVLVALCRGQALSLGRSAWPYFGAPTIIPLVATWCSRRSWADGLANGGVASIIAGELFPLDIVGARSAALTNRPCSAPR